MIWILIVMVWMMSHSMVAAAPTGPGTINVIKESSEGGETIFTMEFRDADLKDVLRALGQEEGLNVIIRDDVGGRLTLSFQRVTVREAFAAILKINNLVSFQDGTIVRVVKSPFAEGVNNMTTEIIPVNFGDAKINAEAIKNFLSQQGSVSVDLRTNSLIVRDLPDNVAKIVSIMKSLDTKTPEVMIEARIVEASTSFARELGIQWGGKFTNQTNGGTYTATGGITNPGGSSSTPSPMTGGLGLSGNPFVVNLPAAVTLGSGGVGAFSFGNVSNTRQLDLQLSAMETSGNGRILSNPRVLTMDNKEAMIATGTEIFVQSVVIAGTTVSTSSGGGSTGGITPVGGGNGVVQIDAKLELTVKPHITPDNQVIMHVKADKKDPDFTREVQGIPPLDTRTAETDLMVKDGETIVIGGIYTRNESKAVSGVPFLDRIPIIGWLFRHDSKNDIQNELLIFITPSIYKRS
jgi:type IV pilus assembly protein PilQ